MAAFARANARQTFDGWRIDTTGFWPNLGGRSPVTSNRQCFPNKGYQEPGNGRTLTCKEIANSSQVSWIDAQIKLVMKL
jgi:hypothetical protein